MTTTENTFKVFGGNVGFDFKGSCLSEYAFLDDHDTEGEDWAGSRDGAFDTGCHYLVSETLVDGRWVCSGSYVRLDTYGRDYRESGYDDRVAVLIVQFHENVVASTLDFVKNHEGATLSRVSYYVFESGKPVKPAHYVIVEHSAKRLAP